MFDIILTEQFDNSFSKIKDKTIQKQIWKKIVELEERAPIGKKLKGNPYWSIHINKYRVICQLEGNQLTVAALLERKKSYREL